MLPLSVLRQHPRFAPLFEVVYPFCWLILVWQLTRLYHWHRREGIVDALLDVNCWGFITVLYIGERVHPNAYTPAARTFRPLTDERWASDLPVCLAEASTCEAPRRLQHFCCAVTPRVRPSVPDTS